MDACNHALPRRAVWAGPPLLAAAALFLGCATARDVGPELKPSPTRPVTTPGVVLFVLTAAPVQALTNGKTRDTGFFLGEFYEVYRAVREAGYDVAFATPGGRPPIVDPESLDAEYWEAHPDWLEPAQRFAAHDAALNAPMELDQARKRADDFAGIVVPGGQGVMIDLVGDADLHALLFDAGRAGRAVGLVCHAPAILARLPTDANPYHGRRVTSVSAAEEFYIERIVMRGRAQDRGIGRQLKKQGFRHQAAFPGKSRAVRDCNLVTSQNPFSGDAFNRHFLAALAADPKRCQPPP